MMSVRALEDGRTEEMWRNRRKRGIARGDCPVLCKKADPDRKQQTEPPPRSALGTAPRRAKERRKSCARCPDTNQGTNVARAMTMKPRQRVQTNVRDA